MTINHNNKHRVGILVMAIFLAVVTFFLGVWQYKRLQWKEGLIAVYEKQASLALADDVFINNVDYGSLLYRRLKVVGKILPDFTRFVGPKVDKASGEFGYFVFVQFMITDGVNNGLIAPLNIGWLKGMSPRVAQLNINYDAKYTLDVTLSNSLMVKNKYMPENNHQNQLWLYLDGKKFLSMHHDNDSKKIDMLYFHLNKQNIWPNIKTTVYKRTFTNNHMNYMLTWFALSFILLLYVGYILFFWIRENDKPIN